MTAQRPENVVRTNLTRPPRRQRPLSKLRGPAIIAPPGPYPVVTLEVGYASSPGTALASTVWTDASAYLLEGELTRGRQFELDRIEAGRLNLKLENLDRRFEPGYANSPYYPNVKPMRRVRLSVTWNTGTYRLFCGFVERWPPSWDGPDDAWTEVTAVDLFESLANATLVATWSAEASDVRIGRVLDAVGWPAGDRMLDVGAETVTANTFVATDEKYALDHIQEIVQAEAGLFFIDGQGRAVFQNRTSRRTGAAGTSQATFSDMAVPGLSFPYEAVSPSYDKERIYNEIRVTRPGGTTQTASDATSQTDYFRRTLTVDPIVTSDASALNIAQEYLRRYQQPSLRWDSIDIVPTWDDGRNQWPGLFQATIGREISDRITVNRTPPAHGGGDSAEVSIASHVEQITHSFSAGQPWRTRFMLSPADSASYWIFDTSHFDVDTVFAFG